MVYPCTNSMKKNKRLMIRNYLSNLRVDVEIAGYTRCPYNWTDLDYTPEYNKFYFILDGEGWLKIGEQELMPRPGQLILMPSGIKQSYSAVSHNTFLKYWCHFNARVGDMNLFDIVQVPMCIDIGCIQFLEDMFRKLVDNYESDDFTATLKITGQMLEILAWYFEQIGIDNIHLSSYSPTEELIKVLDYIENHLSDNIIVDDLARMIHYHPNYFIRFFRDHLGCSPVQYINRLRLEKAKHLLRFTQLTVKEITDISGFNDSSYFSKMFKKHTGFSPVEFRNS